MKHAIDMWLQSGYTSPMSKTSVVRARIEPALKKDAEKVFAQLGLTTSEAIHLLYRQVTLTRSLPFPLHIPNAATRKALRESKEGVGVVSYKNKANLFKKLGV
jgi:DNA-damage-inducible protein J